MISRQTPTTSNITSVLRVCVCVCVGVGVLAVLIVSVFLDNIDCERASQFRENREPFCQTFLATFRLLKDWRLLALIPLTLYSGFEQSFLSGEYTKVGPPRPPLSPTPQRKRSERLFLRNSVSLQNYVTCALGIHYVGFVMMCFGAANSVCSFLFGRLARYTGRLALVCLGKLTGNSSFRLP